MGKKFSAEVVGTGQITIPKEIRDEWNIVVGDGKEYVVEVEVHSAYVKTSKKLEKGQSVDK